MASHVPFDDAPVARARRARSAFARACPDWSERRFHLAGALGTALCTRLFERPTASGRRALKRHFGIELW